ncbi:hypothetical protein PFNF54_05716 [Plasmodium falciparum NF54]|uniref:Uncharacterized protein n=1 Tax=Plasmodium falciparum (isolate NF54) TaxID=5843 RepID=W7JKZ0_PLAFO|nr:hypothetical protein PFNF54_05716 [Plasmodium falciparum NF54]
MVLKDKKYNRKYLKKIKERSKCIREKEEKKSKEDSHYNYDEDLPQYDSKKKKINYLKIKKRKRTNKTEE